MGVGIIPTMGCTRLDDSSDTSSLSLPLFRRVGSGSGSALGTTESTSKKTKPATRAARRVIAELPQKERSDGRRKETRTTGSVRRPSSAAGDKNARDLAAINEGFAGATQKASIITDAVLLQITHQHSKTIRLNLSTVRCGRLSLDLPCSASGAEALVQAWLAVNNKDKDGATPLPLNTLQWQRSAGNDCNTNGAVGHGRTSSLCVEPQNSLDKMGIVDGSELMLEEESYEQELGRNYIHWKASDGPPPLLGGKWRMRMDKVSEVLEQRILAARGKGWLGQEQGQKGQGRDKDKDKRRVSCC